MERSEALVIDKQAYKEICMGIEDARGIFEEIHGVSIEYRDPDFIFVEDFKFYTGDLKD